MSSLATQQYQHGERFNELENAMSNLATQQQQLSTTLVEVLRITAAQNTAIANNNRRIEQILEYLFRERPNGRGEGT
ncbi:MAG: hypothetical protein DSM106950_39710 [Stigonema ocellatum SAG 48.90 = DSM 106950]|nr:hypothetical protein [Stigonema ocellatum SAG 48.90 = DSM 106950]